MRQQATRSHSAGFTVVEMLIIVTIIAIVAGSLLPVITRPYVSEYRAETLTEMQSLQAAIVGPGGFLDTMGRLPNPANASNTLGELWLQGALVPVNTTGHGGLPMGWNGPYIRAQFLRPDLDSWGHAYVLDEPSPNPTGLWRLKSLGPDGIDNTADDIVYPNPDQNGNAIYFQSLGTMTIDLLESDGFQVNYVPASSLTSAVATLYLPDASGAEQSTTCTISADATTLVSQAICSNVPFGTRHLTLTSPSFATVDVNLNFDRPNSYARVFVEPASTDALVTNLPVTTSRVITGSATLAPNPTTLVLPAMSVTTSLDVEVNGTMAIVGADTTTSCQVSVSVGGVNYGTVSIRDTAVETPFRISVDPTIAPTLSVLANGTPPAIQVVAQSSGGSDSCQFGSATGTDNGINAFVMRYMQQ